MPAGKQKQPSTPQERSSSDKKALAQREGLALLEKLLLDVAATGQWFLPERLDRLDRHSLQLGDAYLPNARTALRRLVQVGRRKNLGEDERNSQASELIGRLWAMVQVGSRYLDGTLSGDEATEADAVLDEALGKNWRLDELRARGDFRKDLHLLELAHERFEDEVTDLRIEVGFLLDLNEGAVFRAVNYRPRKVLDRTPELPSYTGPIFLPEAAIYPGFLTRRVRWEAGTEERLPAHPDSFRLAHSLAQPDFARVLTDFRKQIKNPLAPREAVVLLRCQLIGTLGERVVVVDAQDNRLETADRRMGYSHVDNLRRAGGELRQQPALLARLFLRPHDSVIVAQPLALLSPEKHLRLGV